VIFHEHPKTEEKSWDGKRGVCKSTKVADTVKKGDWLWTGLLNSNLTVLRGKITKSPRRRAGVGGRQKQRGKSLIVTIKKTAVQKEGLEVLQQFD